MTWREAADILGQYDSNFYYTSGEHKGEAISADVLIGAFEKGRRALCIVEWIEAIVKNVHERIQEEEERS